MAAFKNDGTVQYGSKVISLGTLVPGTPATISSGVSFVADDISIDRPSKTVERTTELDEPSGQVSYLGFVTGSATLQLATASTIPPIHGKHFLLTVFDTDGDGDLDLEVFYVDSVSQPFTKDGETKVPVTFRKCYNTTA
jgi:hypothetical protein